MNRHNGKYVRLTGRQQRLLKRIRESQQYLHVSAPLGWDDRAQAFYLLPVKGSTYRKP